MDDLLSTISKNFRALVTKEHFCQICQEKIDNIGNLNLTKNKYRSFLSAKFGNSMADKLCLTLDFTQAVDYATFCKQVEQLVGERSLLLQLAFDVFDSNNDGRLSELDLFKALFNYDKSTKDKNSFVEVLLDDFNRITKIFKSNWSTKLTKLLADNN